MRLLWLTAILLYFSLSACAQWYRLDVKVHYLLMRKERSPALAPVINYSVKRLPRAVLKYNTPVYAGQLDHEYAMELTEAEVIRTAQHNMRFRLYNDASYNFSELATMYIRREKYTEAKWYLLQSNSLSRAQNDDKHTVANLLALASVKIKLGDFAQATQDLSEARHIAAAMGFREDLLVIENKLLSIKDNKPSAEQSGVRHPFTELPQATGKRQ